MMWRDRALKAIKERGGKLTPQRLKIVQVIEELGPRHPSLKEVLARVREEFPTVSFSTLYNNVMTLKEAGLLQVFYYQGEARIEVNTDPHLNMISGEEIVDVIDEEITHLIEKKIGRRVLFVNVYVAHE